MLINRRTFTVSGLGAVGLAALGRSAFAAAAPKSPVTINVIDVAGNLALTRPAFDAYKAAKPNFVSAMTFTQAPAPELPAKIKAQQNAGRVEIDLVLTGTDALAAGIEQGLWTQLLPSHAMDLPALDSIYLPAAAKMQTLANGEGVVVTYYPSGPLFEYMPDRVKTPPKTAAELMAWAKANDGRFMYARPANSGPGRTLLMGLPYILGDKDPMNPKTGWDKTWAYLLELGKIGRILPLRHRRDDERARRGFARHDRHHHRLGHQPARARHRAEGSEGVRARWHALGRRRALHVRAQGRQRREARRAPRPDELSPRAEEPSLRLRQGLFLSRPGGQGRAALHGAGRRARTR